MPLNRAILMGRITRELEIKTTQSGISVLTFGLAVERNYTRQGEEKQTDFINCIAWRQTAEFINRYFGKGSLIAIEGNLQTRTYDDKNGTKHYVTEVIVDNVSFTGEKKESSAPAPVQAQTPAKPSSKPTDYRQLSNEDRQAEMFDMGDFEEIISDNGVPF